MIKAFASCFDKSPARAVKHMCLSSRTDVCQSRKSQSDAIGRRMMLSSARMATKIKCLQSSLHGILSFFVAMLVSGGCLAAITHTYDNLNRLTSVDYGNGTSITYQYDAAGNLTQLQAIGSTIATCAAINGPSTPTVNVATSYSAACANTSAYVWKLNGTVINACTTANCAVTFAATGANTLTVAPSTALANTASLAVTVSATPAPTCSLVTGQQSIPAAANSQTYVATCSNTSTYVWSLDGVPIASCAASTCAVSFPANSTAASVNRVVAVAPSGNPSSIYRLFIGQASATAPLQCSGSASGQLAISAIGGTFTYAANCTGAARYTWTVNGTLNTCTTATCAITFPANATASTVAYNIGFTAFDGTVNTYSPSPLTVTVAAAPATCSLDFDGDGAVSSADALLMMRWLLGFRGDALVSGVPPYPVGATASAFAASVTGRMTLGLVHDLDGDGKVQAATDGVLLTRLVRGMTGSAVTNGALGTGAQRATHELIRSYANTNCGTTFQSGLVLGTQPTVVIDTNQNALTALGAVFPADTAYSFVTGVNGRTAVKFNGLSNPGAVRIPNNAAMQFTTGATFDLWARIDGGTGMSGANGLPATTGWAMALVSKSHDSGSVSINAYGPDAAYAGGGYGFATWSSSVTGWGAGACTVVTRNPGAALGTWFRLTAVASTTTGTRIYHNKQLVYTCPSAVPNFTGMNGQDLYLGKYRDSWYPLDGAVQDIRIYQSALTDAEVQALP